MLRRLSFLMGEQHHANRWPVEPELEARFLPDSYGYRPGRSALEAVAVTRQRCWQYSWVLEFQIKGLVGNIDHALLLRAFERHVKCEWTMLYLKRWLTAPLQHADGTLEDVPRGRHRAASSVRCWSICSCTTPLTSG